jgi:hypothetical protein
MTTYITFTFRSNDKLVRKYIECTGSDKFVDNYIIGYEDALIANKSVRNIQVDRTTDIYKFIKTIPIRRVSGMKPIRERDLANNPPTPCKAWDIPDNEWVPVTSDDGSKTGYWKIDRCDCCDDIYEQLDRDLSQSIN